MKNTNRPCGLRETLALNLRRIRKQRGLSQETLADIVGLHRTYVGSIERGERNLGIDTVEKIANALDVEVGELLK